METDYGILKHKEGIDLMPGNIEISGLEVSLVNVMSSKVRIFENSIPISVRAAEISAEGVSIYEHDPKGKVAAAYQSLTEEVLGNE